MIHSRKTISVCPYYFTLEKLFSPVPHELSNGRLSLFGEFMIAMFSVEARIRDFAFGFGLSYSFFTGGDTLHLMLIYIA